MKFLTEAVERGAYDNLKTPSGAIVTGKPAVVGCGMCKILPRIDLRERKIVTTAGTTTAVDVNKIKIEQQIKNVPLDYTQLQKQPIKEEEEEPEEKQQRTKRRHDDSFSLDINKKKQRFSFS